MNDKQKTATSHTPDDINNVDKIRDILFGNQIKDFEHKFSQLQDTLTKELKKLSDDSAMRTDSLEKFVKSEFESLNQRLDSEQKIRIKDLQENTDDLEKRIKTLDNRLVEHEKQSNDKARELRQLLLGGCPKTST